MAIKTETISVKVSAEEKAQIKEIAQEQELTISKLLYKIIFNNVKEIKSKWKE